MYPRTIRKTGLQGEATPKQIEYAEAIAELLGVAVGQAEAVDFCGGNMMQYSRRHLSWRRAQRKAPTAWAGANQGRRYIRKLRTDKENPLK